MSNEDLGKLNLYGIGVDELGAPLPVFCAKCKTKLTAVFLNQKCVIDISVECSACGFKTEGRDLRAEIQGKIEKGEFKVV